MLRRGFLLLAVVAFVWACGGSQEDKKAAGPEVNAAAKTEHVVTPPPVDDDGYEELDVWIEAEPDEGAPPLKVHFTSDVESDEESSDEGGKFRYKWDFGDGAGSSEANPTHVYTKLGEYTVTLVANDDEGNNGSDEIDVWVEEED